MYPPITHWAWTDEGWLKKLGYVDYSGCGPVHLLGGVCSFYGALFIGPRIGKFKGKYSQLEKEDIVGHSVPVSIALYRIINLTEIIVFCPSAGLSLINQHSSLYPLLSLPFRIFIQSIHHNVIYHLISSFAANLLSVYHSF